MKTPALGAALLAAACAHQPASMQAPASLAAAETDFAAHSVRDDMRVAFLAAFADDGVLARNGWIVSNTFMAGRAAPPIVLDWRPQYVEVAASGELGLSTGPSKITSKAKPDTPPAYGQFVSIWRRAPGGPWKVEVDLGITHPQPTLWDVPLQALTVPAVAAQSGPGIAEAEAEFQRIAAKSGTRAAYAALATAELRLYRNGVTPQASRVAALAALPAAEEGLRWTSERTETARSGDFGYARGSYAKAVSPSETLGYFLRVWRREAGGWRIVLDVVNPHI